MRPVRSVVSMALLLGVLGFAPNPAGADDLHALAERAEAEFTARGEGTFVETGYAVYCRMGVGFDEGVFEQIQFEPQGKGFEYCYNVSEDRERVALAEVSGRDGSVRCLIVDARSGEPQRSEITNQSPCLP